jgi:ParB family chromosome partitioning protein
MEKKALGRGLSALLSSNRHVEDALNKEVPLTPRPTASGVAETSHPTEKGVVFVETGRLAPNRFQPRVQFDEEALKELVASIREKGVLAPILVRNAKDGRYEIIAGERRFRAAQQLKLTRVPVVVRDVDDQEALVLSIVENVQREELNPIEEAQAFQRLIKEFSSTQEDIARAVSKDRSTVANMLRLLTLPAEVQKVIASGRLSFGHGKALLGLDSVAQQVKLTHLVLSNSLSVRELENYISGNKLTSPKNRKPPKDKDPHVADVEKQLQHAYGTKVRIFDLKKRGRIQFEYYSAQDRDRILKLLIKK